MRGPVNSPITLTIVRKGVEDPFDVKVTRDVIHINPVKYSAEGDDVGYIRITTFNEQTTANLQKAIEDLKKQLGPKLKGYIIDLRNNPGGLLDQAISVSDAFLDQGAIVLTTRPQSRGDAALQRAAWRSDRWQAAHRADQRRLGLGVGNRRRRTSGPSPCDHPRHAVLRQGLGADHHSARLERRARLTTARYYTPSGRSIQAKGIEPEVVVEEELPDDLKKKADDLEHEAAKPICAATSRSRAPTRTRRPREEESGSSSYVAPEKDKDTQLKYALDLLRGIKSVDTDTKKKAEAN